MKKTLLFFITPLLSLLFLSHLTNAMEQMRQTKVKFFLGKIVNKTDHTWAFYGARGLLEKPELLATVFPHAQTPINHEFSYEQRFFRKFSIKNLSEKDKAFSLSVFIIHVGSGAIDVEIVLKKSNPPEEKNTFEQIFVTNDDIDEIEILKYYLPKKPFFLISKNDDVSVVINIIIDSENGDYTAFLDYFIETKAEAAQSKEYSNPLEGEFYAVKKERHRERREKRENAEQ